MPGDPVVIELTDADVEAMQAVTASGKVGEHLRTTTVRLVDLGIVRQSLDPGVFGMTEHGKGLLHEILRPSPERAAPPDPTITPSWVGSLNLVLNQAYASVTWRPVDAERAEKLRRWFVWDCIQKGRALIAKGEDYAELDRFLAKVRSVLDVASLAPAEDVQALVGEGMDMWAGYRAARAQQRDSARASMTAAVNTAGAVGYGLRGVPQGPGSAARLVASAAGAVAWSEVGGTDQKAKAKARDAATNRVLGELAKALQGRIDR